MDRKVYDIILHKCEEAVNKQKDLAELYPDFTEWLEEQGITWDTVMSIYSQVYQAHVRKNNHKHKAKSSITKYVQEYKNGTHIAKIAQQAQYSPYFMARIITEAILQPKKKEMKEIAKNPTLIPDKRLSEEFQYCVQHDRNCSPIFDRLRRTIGEDCERYLETRLEYFGIPFESEDALRERGMAKTPDIHLLVPIGVKGENGNFYIVHWIDSKGMFGDHTTHAKRNMEQLQGYVNRFGPGMVIYWTGYLAELNDDPNILLVSDFPYHHTSLVQRPV